MKKKGNGKIGNVVSLLKKFLIRITIDSTVLKILIKETFWGFKNDEILKLIKNVQ